MQRYTLGELEQMGMLSLGRGKIISRRDLQEHPGPYPVYSSSAVKNGEIGRYGEYMFEDERITWSIDGGGKLFYRPAHRYSVTNVGGWIRVESPRLSTKFLFEVLTAQWETMQFDYVRKAHPSVLRTLYTVPLPPIETQRETAGRLEVFRELIGTLSDELEGRKQQLDWLRDRLLTGKQRPLSAVAEIIDCPHTTPHWQEAGVPVIRNFNLRDGAIDRTKLFFVSEADYADRIRRAEPTAGDILFSREAPVGNVGLVPENFRCCQGQRVVLLRADREKILPQYLLEVLQSRRIRAQFRHSRTGATAANLTLAELAETEIPVPEPETQRQLLRDLHPLAALCRESLPAEIRLREAQLRQLRELLI